MARFFHGRILIKMPESFTVSFSHSFPEGNAAFHRVTTLGVRKQLDSPDLLDTGSELTLIPVDPKKHWSSG